jgi:hypothetical protein
MTREELFETADREAAEDVYQAGPEGIIAGTVDPAIRPDLAPDLLAHELAACHRLMLRLCAAANAILDWADAAAGDTESAELAAGRLAAVASRLMEQLRQGLAVLRRLRPEVRLGFWWRELIPAEPQDGTAEAPAQPESQTDEPFPPARVRAIAASEATELAAVARTGALAAASADTQVGLSFLTRLLAHELGAAHALAMRLTGSAHAALDRATGATAEPTAALRLAGIVARLGLRVRRGLLALAGPGGDARAARA